MHVETITPGSSFARHVTKYQDDPVLHYCESLTGKGRRVWLTTAELQLVNQIRKDRGLGPVCVIHTNE